MRAVVTVSNPDGSFDEVGMSNRTVVGPYSEHFIRREAMRLARGRRVRVELFPNESIYGEPIRTMFITPN